MRPLLAIIIGNGLGWGAWALGWRALPWLWDSVDITVGDSALLGRIALSAIMMAAPPVLIGALSAWLAGRAHLWVGVACGLWSLSLIQATPPELLLEARVWYAPAVLVLLSTAMGGWLMDLQAQAEALHKPSVKT